MPNAGVPVIVAVRGDGPAACAVNVRETGFPACVIVRLFAASASVAVAVIVAIGVPSFPFTDAGATEICSLSLHFGLPIKTVVVLAVALVAPVPSLTVHSTL